MPRVPEAQPGSPQAMPQVDPKFLAMAAATMAEQAKEKAKGK